MNTRALALIVFVLLMAWPNQTRAAIEDINDAWLRQALLNDADTYNGGVSSVSGSVGMGAYESDWDGRFRTSLDRMFREINTSLNTNIRIHGRAIRMNVNAYEFAESESQRERLRQVVLAGSDYLITHATDLVYGGYYYVLRADGVVATSASQTWKRTMGHAYVASGLAGAYEITGESRFLDGAFDAIDAINQHLGDPRTGDPVGLPSAFVTGAEREFAPIRNVTRRNINDLNHVLEALVDVYDVADDARRVDLATQIEGIGNFVVTDLFQIETGSIDRGYLPYNYDADWNPIIGDDSGSSSGTYVNNAQHTEWATLLSLAVERGLGDPSWIDAANKLINFTLAHGYDAAVGGQLRLRVRFDGTPYADKLAEDEGYADWEQAELARALLRYAALHDRDDLWPVYQQIQSLFTDYLSDDVYGGTYNLLSSDPLNLLDPIQDGKASIHEINYHIANYYTDALRIFSAATIPEPQSAVLWSIAMCLLGRRRGIAAIPTPAFSRRSGR